MFITKNTVFQNIRILLIYFNIISNNVPFILGWKTFDTPMLLTYILPVPAPPVINIRIEYP